MWTYSIGTGDLFDVAGERIANGYSGWGDGKNNVAQESLPDVGPIPRGWYRIGSAFASPHCGPVTMRLKPSDTTQTFGRGEFEIHGDNATHTASHGCIVLPLDARQRLAKSLDRDLHVTA